VGKVVPVVATVDEPARTYTTPQAAPEPSMALSSAQLASYLVAHSEYTSPLSRSSLVTGTTIVAAPEQATPPASEGGD
jgi:hypothetical protein